MLAPLMLTWWGLCFGYYGLSTWISVLVDHLKLGNTEKARDNCTKALAIEPANVKALFRRGKCHAALGMSRGDPDWVTIHGLLGSAVYGGRVDNQQDERLLHVYLQQFFSSSMLTQKERRVSVHHGQFLILCPRFVSMGGCRAPARKGKTLPLRPFE